MTIVRKTLATVALIGGVSLAALSTAHASSDYNGYADGSIVPSGSTVGAGTTVTITWNHPATQTYRLCDDSAPADGPTVLGARMIASMNDMGNSGGWTEVATYNYSSTSPVDTAVSGTYKVPSDWAGGGYIQAGCLPTGTSGEADYNGQLLLALPPGVSTVAAGAGNVTTNGTLAGMTVAVDRAGTSLIYDAADFELSLAADCGTSLCTVIKDDSGKNVIDATAGGAVKIGGQGFDVGTPVDVYVYSTPTYLGRVTVDSSGAFSGNMTLPSTLKPGRHTLQLIGTAKASTQIADLGVVLRGTEDESTSDDKSAASDSLPSTGNQSTNVLLAAVMFLGAGVATRVMSRRRVLG